MLNLAWRHAANKRLDADEGAGGWCTCCYTTSDMLVDRLTDSRGARVARAWRGTDYDFERCEELLGSGRPGELAWVEIDFKFSGFHVFCVVFIGEHDCRVLQSYGNLYELRGQTMPRARLLSLVAGIVARDKVSWVTLTGELDEAGGEVGLLMVKLLSCCASFDRDAVFLAPMRAFLGASPLLSDCLRRRCTEALLGFAFFRPCHVTALDLELVPVAFPEMSKKTFTSRQTHTNLLLSGDAIKKGSTANGCPVGAPVPDSASREFMQPAFSNPRKPQGPGPSTAPRIHNAEYGTLNLNPEIPTEASCWTDDP